MYIIFNASLHKHSFRYTYQKRTLGRQGFKVCCPNGICSFLYILDLTGFTVDMNDLKMYKNSAFYTYA